MRVIMTGGGTGGHIYPAIAIADKIVERSYKAEILFVGTRRGLEGELVPSRGYPIKFIDVQGLDRRNMFKNVKVLAKYLKAKNRAEDIIEEFDPDVVIGTGGYVCGPVVNAAAGMGIRCFIQEQNAFPGLTNKMLEKKVENVFLGFEDAGQYFKYPEKHIVTGNPVRSEFFTANKETSRKLLGIPQDDFVLLAFGGSQGASRLNRGIMDVIKQYSGKDGIQVYFATGKNYYEPVISDLEGMGVPLDGNIHVEQYISDMNTYLSACDLAVCRSGALTVSEIAISKKASILIPSPNVTGDHQTYNARALSDKGAAILLPESKLVQDSTFLYKEIEALRIDDAYREGMAAKCGLLAPTDATDIIYYSLLS